MFLSLWIDLVQIRFDCSLCVLKCSLIWLRNWYYEDFENISCEINLDLSTRMFIFVNVNVLVLSISYYHTIEIHKYNCMYIYDSAICLIIVIIVFPSAWLHLAIFEVRFRGAKVHWPTSISTTRCWEINICPKVITRPQALCCWPRGNNKKKGQGRIFQAADFVLSSENGNEKWGQFRSARQDDGATENQFTWASAGKTPFRWKLRPWPT